MVKMQEKKRLDRADFHTWLAILYADTKAEVVPGVEIVDKPDDSDLEPGSGIYTGDGHSGILLSDGTWSWDE